MNSILTTLFRLYVKPAWVLFFLCCCLTGIGQESNQFDQVAKHVSKVPKKESRDLDQLTDYLVSPFSTDIEKIKAIYMWIGINIKYDTRDLEDQNKAYNHDPFKVFKRKKGVCTGYANLLAHMAARAEITALTVSGYSKNSVTSSSKITQPDHVWNAVLLKGEWRLIDVTWDAGLWTQQNKNGKNRKANYFLADPKLFILDHLPALPMWQLLDTLIKPQGFLNETRETLQVHSSTQNYDSLINHFIKLPRAEQRYYEYQETYRFYPTPDNGRAMAHGLLDYASILSDSIETLQVGGSEEDTLLALTEQVVGLCAEAEEHTDFHDWQTRMYADALVSMTIYLYNAEIKKETPDKDTFEAQIATLEKAEELIKGVKRDFWTESSIRECQQLLSIISERIARFK